MSPEAEDRDNRQTVVAARLLYPLDFEQRTLDDVRRWTEDLPDCASAEISVVWNGQAPAVRFVFGQPIFFGRPAFAQQLVAESRSNPLAPGRLMQGEELKRVLRDGIERYLKLNGIQLARKVLQQDG